MQHISQFEAMQFKLLFLTATATACCSFPYRSSLKGSNEEGRGPFVLSDCSLMALLNKLFVGKRIALCFTFIYLCVCAFKFESSSWLLPVNNINSVKKATVKKVWQTGNTTPRSQSPWSQHGHVWFMYAGQPVL